MVKSRKYTFVPVTRENAETAQMFYNVKYRNADGTPMRARRNGATKTWKTRPSEFRIPVKYGLYDCFYIDHNNMASWAIACTEVID